MANLRIVRSIFSVVMCAVFSIATAAHAQTLTPTPFQPDPKTIPGLYSVARIASDGTVTQGSLTLTEETVQYRAGWTFESGKQDGIALLRGDVLSIASGDSSCYLIVYKAAPVGSLDGVWSAVGLRTVKTLGIELAGHVGPLPTKAGDLAGNYDLSGRNWDAGQIYRGVLTLTQRDDHLALDWKIGESAYRGVGLQVGDWLSVAASLDPNVVCTLTVFRVGEDRTLEGLMIDTSGAVASPISAGLIEKPKPG